MNDRMQFLLIIAIMVALIIVAVLGMLQKWPAVIGGGFSSYG